MHAVISGFMDFESLGVLEIPGCMQ
jgi:hypothetical protein